MSDKPIRQVEDISAADIEQASDSELNGWLACAVSGAHIEKFEIKDEAFYAKRDKPPIEVALCLNANGRSYHAGFYTHSLRSCARVESIFARDEILAEEYLGYLMRDIGRDEVMASQILLLTADPRTRMKAMLKTVTSKRRRLLRLREKVEEVRTELACQGIYRI